MAGPDAQLICASTALPDGGSGHRFWVLHAGARTPAFVVRYRGQAHAYLNRCTHRWVELDWDAGRFYSIDGRHLICATHGALYRPDTGACAGGPCSGGLVKLELIEKNEGVYLAASAVTRLFNDD
jgi:nitrite reductase/ring-hydroxylating ferredoxin subunit